MICIDQLKLQLAVTWDNSAQVTKLLTHMKEHCPEVLAAEEGFDLGDFPGNHTHADAQVTQVCRSPGAQSVARS